MRLLREFFVSALYRFFFIIVQKREKFNSKKRKIYHQKEKFQLFLFLMLNFAHPLYFCPVAMLRRLKNEEDENEKTVCFFLVRAAGAGIM